jgi:hypothetical protein
MLQDHKNVLSARQWVFKGLILFIYAFDCYHKRNSNSAFFIFIQFSTLFENFSLLGWISSELNAKSMVIEIRFRHKFLWLFLLSPQTQICKFITKFFAISISVVVIWSENCDTKLSQMSQLCDNLRRGNWAIFVSICDYETREKCENFSWLNFCDIFPSADFSSAILCGH